MCQKDISETESEADIWNRCLCLHGYVASERDAHSLNIHTNKYIITICIRCSKGKAQGIVQAYKRAWPCSGVKELSSNDIWAEVRKNQLVASEKIIGRTFQIMWTAGTRPYGEEEHKTWRERKEATRGRGTISRGRGEEESTQEKAAREGGPDHRRPWRKGFSYFNRNLVKMKIQDQ